jgi:flagellar biosynthetic protein FlhB
MAEDRTERATPKRRSDARARGQVARSTELNTGASVLTLFVLLSAVGGSMLAGFGAVMSRTLAGAGQTESITPAAAWALATDTGMQALRLGAPFGVAALVIGVLASAVQVRPGFFPKVVTPRFSAISPKTGVKRLFSVRSLIRLVKDIGKVALVGGITWWVLKGRVPEILGLMGADPATTLSVVGGIILQLGLTVGVAYLVLSLADIAYERWQHEKDMRMTKDEVKREGKDADIPQEVKGMMKRRQREMAITRMMAAVPKADVVITNPTHYAVALRYARNLPAPMVVAKGVDNVAFRIIGVAREHDVAVMQDPPLARSLYAAAEVGQYIPADAFAAVAEILALVYRVSGREPAAA